jgi:signal transduction histidine kinase
MALQMKPKLYLLAVAGALAGGVAVWLAAHVPPNRPTEPGALLTLAVGASLLGSGIASWRARPENRLGPVMVFTGFAWFAGLLSEASGELFYTIGSAVQYVFIAGFVYILLSFPSGVLHTRSERVLAGVAIALSVGFQLLAMLYGNKSGLRCDTCPNNLLQVFHNNTRAHRLLDDQRLLAGVMTVSLIALLIRRWLRASPAQRRAVAPVLLAGCAMLTALTGTVVDDLLGDPLQGVPAMVFFYSSAAVPIAVVVVFLQRRLARGGVAGLVVSLGQPSASADLREALARALGDPSLELAFWLPAERRYVSGEGRPVRLPENGGDRLSTTIERDGQPIAVLLHDPALQHNAELVRSVCAAAALALENERLQAELRARLVELQASRARLVQATDAERRRIERDLHDGTQQRLVSIAMSLGLLEPRLPQGGSAVPIVRETREALALALQELRELSHGIHPALLSERGLAAALDELCGRAALPTRLEVTFDRRLPAEFESAAYFFASEALTNAAKHSHASEARVAAAYEDQTLTVEVSDDGIGGATPGHGSGLRGLADRIEALGGTMTLSSPPGRGTSLRAEIPCE